MSWWTTIAVSGVALLLSGCPGEPMGDETLPTVPVHGTLMVNGKPARNAFVNLIPDVPIKSPSVSRTKVSPNAQVDKEGNFKISTFNEADGAPPGTYKVSITWHKATGFSRQKYDGEDRLNGEYADEKKNAEKDPALFAVTVPESSETPVIIGPYNLEVEIDEEAGKTTF
jgi:hypothetical protein